MTEEIQDRIQQGIELMAAQRYEAARDAFIGVLKLDKGNYEAHFNLAKRVREPRRGGCGRR